MKPSVNEPLEVSQDRLMGRDHSHRTCRIEDHILVELLHVEGELTDDAKGFTPVGQCALRCEDHGPLRIGLDNR